MSSIKIDWDNDFQWFKNVQNAITMWCFCFPYTHVSFWLIFLKNDFYLRGTCIGLSKKVAIENASHFITLLLRTVIYGALLTNLLSKNSSSSLSKYRHKERAVYKQEPLEYFPNCDWVLFVKNWQKCPYFGEHFWCWSSLVRCIHYSIDTMKMRDWVR